MWDNSSLGSYLFNTFIKFMHRAFKDKWIRRSSTSIATLHYNGGTQSSGRFMLQGASSRVVWLSTHHSFLRRHPSDCSRVIYVPHLIYHGTPSYYNGSLRADFTISFSPHSMLSYIISYSLQFSFFCICHITITSHSNSQLMLVSTTTWPSHDQKLGVQLGVQLRVHFDSQIFTFLHNHSTKSHDLFTNQQIFLSSIHLK